MSKNLWLGVALCTLSLLTVGCGKAADQSGTKTSDASKAVDARYVLKEEPKDAREVKAARESVSDNEHVTLVGRIGGDEKPWVDGVAAFSIVDTSLNPCPADEGCPTPWDYCCDVGELRTAKAMVKVVDADGQTVQKDARELLGVKELSTVIVHGRAKKDESGNLTILADGVFVRN